MAATRSNTAIRRASTEYVGISARPSLIAAQHDTAEDVQRTLREASRSINNRAPPPRPTRRLREPTKVSVSPVRGGPILLTASSMHVYCHASDNRIEDVMLIDRLVRTRGLQGRKLFLITERTGDWEVTVSIDEAAIPSQAHQW